MSTTTVPAPAARATAPRLRRLMSLTRAETLLLLRNRTALMYALALPVAFVLLFSVVGGIGREDAVGQEVSAGVLVTLLTISLIFVVYYNITTAYVARREDRVLQRLLTGSASRLDVLLAPAVPPAVIVLAQVVLGYVAVTLLLDPPGLVNPVLVLLAAVGGTAVMVALAAATAGMSRTVESVQLTTLPVIVLVLPFAGMFPLPQGSVIDTVARFTPLRGVTDLLWLGLTGRDADGATLTFAETFVAAAQPLGVVILWTALAAWAARRWMRWAPRR
ncbi:ABC transporter permease [Isoptericola dokdonensis]|jgi:ABC-2 type transport system permease protein|uniref:ABC-2 family transporter protein n=1 Tax=Isoptericola dokdonensis DS-3 TaxID=1300344 RepID=A0A168FSV5_9MICO|nr:ABC transporter permease [Isoptericola dokdonensis]ANC32436.1 ABC-2 family transporter protein [Isoptericola dokdonensis DS-3]